MSENKKPENLLAEIVFSKTHVRTSFFRHGVYVAAKTFMVDVEGAVRQELGRLLTGQKCGLVIDASQSWDGSTFILVYSLKDKSEDHLWHVLKGLPGLLPAASVKKWLVNYFQTIPVVYTNDEIEARTGVRLDRPELLTPAEWFKKNFSNGSHILVGSTPIASDPTDHIPALRGLFAFARGNYATVSPEDLQAAVDAGYVHPDVLSAVADEIAYATGKAE
ncbi:hypothetical protein ASD54_08810 [Rhizobium sp. Root149]|uniref:hypothetical protein n=1 Tax=Rhizobium sp. Root149 TaxID=1736473 RepID=UPI000715E135|nr:hypothetical protein [Rhizobium sp. Root149]KQZ50344.1 hypothetical protein ASD54_08810 [Rhizobium sp. Root149]